MAQELGASRIYLVGMDLGSEIGKYSGDKDPKRKIVKLSICKELLAWLAGDLGAKLINLTAKGEHIPKFRGKLHERSRAQVLRRERHRS
jgi:hypothetical protein